MAPQDLRYGKFSIIPGDAIGDWSGGLLVAKQMLYHCVMTLPYILTGWFIWTLPCWQPQPSNLLQRSTVGLREQASLDLTPLVKTSMLKVIVFDQVRNKCSQQQCQGCLPSSFSVWEDKLSTICSKSILAYLNFMSWLSGAIWIKAADTFPPTGSSIKETKSDKCMVS